MKKIFYPKLLFPVIKLLFILFFLSMLLFSVKNLIENISLKFDFWILMGSFLLLSFIGLVIFHLTYFLSFYFKFLEINETGIFIFELIKMKKSYFSFNDIKGYSKSEVYFGRNMWKSKSIVIYFNNGIQSEIVSVFVTNLTELEKILKNKKIKYLGFEGYQTGLFYREYKYEKNKS
ncbi:MAG: hypothetical protein KGZ81_02700 [Flavobacteriales bacterium]|nr:hypothetical protein [Flavobacteriales bacterium]